MDIQEMVNARIVELRNQTAQAASSLNGQEGRNIRGLHNELAGLGEMTDNILTEIATRVLDLTEQVSGDYARLERDLLNSRLALLQSAERVLDMALSLKTEARKIIDSGLSQTDDVSQGRLRGSEIDRPADAPGGWQEEDDHGLRLSSRASMINNGVADLFRKTQY